MKHLSDLRRLLTMPTAAAAFALVTACGQTGPLYLPAKPAPVPPAATTPTAPAKPDASATPSAPASAVRSAPSAPSPSPSR